jgi:hypothetical protein
MANSQNGWPVLDSGTSGPPPRLRHWQIPGTGRKIMLRDGSAGFLLIHLATWFDRRIEALDTGIFDDWGWASRPVRGSTIISNHASGTAMDLNATKHPMGVSTRATFSNQEIEWIHRRLRFYRGCIRWGGDYQGRPDGMHFELNKGMPAVEKRARELTDSKRGARILNANPGAKALIFS